jgi:SDR family mycofactocin-dependent oxidoreductase
MASAEELDAAVAGAREAGVEAVAVRGDAAAESTVARAVAAAEDLGGLEVVVAAAGVIAGGAPAWELDAERERAVVEVNLLGVLTAARVAVPALLARPAPRAGRFVAVASAAATRGLPGLAAYCAAKAGVAGFVRGLAADLRGTGIVASAVSPGSTRTAMLAESARLYRLGGTEAFASQVPIERLLEPAEVASAIAWLAGEGGAAVTGATFPVDGGLSL